MDKKKMKLLKGEVIRLKKCAEDHDECIQKLEAENKKLKEDMKIKEETIQDLLEKNNKLEDNMLQLQSKMMEEMGLTIPDKPEETPELI